MKLKYITLFIVCVFIYIGCSSSSADEDVDIIIPPVVKDPTEGFNLGGLQMDNEIGHPPLSETWEYVNSFSDDFNYSGKGSEFTAKWKDTYFNNWDGPGLTEWTNNNSAVLDGNLIISASRKAGTNKVYCGVITSKDKIKYPIYTEVRAKVANQVLSSNFWFLSEDDKREIDVVECYGSDRADQTWFANRASSNTHVFIRNSTTNAIIEDFNDQTHHENADKKPWRDDFHRFGIYWKDAFNLDVYYDGELVDQIRTADIKDPENLGIDREMFMIIDLEDHDWRSNQNPPIAATDAELSDETKNKYFIDYVRTYKPKAEFDGGLIKNGSFNSPDLKNWYWNGNVTINTSVSENEGEVYTLNLGTAGSIIQKIAVSKNTNYKLEWKCKNPNGSAKVSVDSLKEVNINTAENWKSGILTFNSGEQNNIHIIINNTGSQSILFDNFILTKQ